MKGGAAGGTETSFRSSRNVAPRPTVRARRSKVHAISAAPLRAGFWLFLPCANGRSATLHQSLQLPAYSAVVPRPASSITIRLGTALTPLPQWCTTVAGSRPPSKASNSALSSAAGLNLPSGPMFWLEGRFSAPGIWPATGSSGSTSPLKRGVARASTKVWLGRPRCRATWSASTSTAFSGASRKFAWKCAGSSPLATAPPAACQACSPPSSTATLSWPAHFSIHQRRPQ